MRTGREGKNHVFPLSHLTVTCVYNMKEPTTNEWTPEMDAYYERLHLYRRLYFPLRDKGMACFNDEGYMEELCVDEGGRLLDVWGAEVIPGFVWNTTSSASEGIDRCAFARDFGRPRSSRDTGEFKTTDWKRKRPASAGKETQLGITGARESPFISRKHSRGHKCATGSA